MAKKKRDGANDAYNTTADELRQFVESIETLMADAKAIADDIKEKYAEAKGRGFDTKALRAIIAERKKNADDVQEFAAVLDMYREALGMGVFSGNGHGGDDEGGEDGEDSSDGII